PAEAIEAFVLFANDQEAQHHRAPSEPLPEVAVRLHRQQDRGHGRLIVARQKLLTCLQQLLGGVTGFGIQVAAKPGEPIAKALAGRAQALLVGNSGQGFVDAGGITRRSRDASALKAGFWTVGVNRDFLGWHGLDDLRLDAVAGEELDQLRLRQHALEAVRRSPLLHQDAEWNALHAKRFGELLLLLGVDLAEHKRAAILLAELLQERRQSPARLAPSRPKVQ